MRGDSLRDLYAKTLAVLGLGLLAAAGAVVDYWPVGASAPAISSPRLPRPDVPLLAQHLDQTIPAPAFDVARARPVVVRGTIHARNVGSARFLTPAVEPTRATTVTSASKPLPAFHAPIESQWQVALAPVDMTAAVYQEMSPPINAAPASGLIGGALRKTKDSIVRAGAVTGSTLADALKGVGGAFKKVTPF